MKRVLLAKKELQLSPLAVSATNIFFPFTIRISVIILFSFLFGGVLFAQNNAAEPGADYQKVIHDRVVKIVNVLGITDSVKYNKVVQTISTQYFTLNSIHEKSKETVNGIKQQVAAGAKDEAIKKEEEAKSALLTQQHGVFIAQLKKELTEEQLEKVKDGMTYRVLPVTWTAYQDMIPSLTAGQKEKMYAWLLEARELAMDAESSEKKHAVFGKYKGRINNYLSSAGYDMKKEEKEWQARIKEREQKKAGAN